MLRCVALWNSRPEAALKLQVFNVLITLSKVVLPVV